MPNHVDNDLIITGPKKDRDALRERASGDHDALDANKFIPYPEKFRVLDEARREAEMKAERGEITREEAWAVKDGYNSGGYEWCIENWGTKWGFYDVEEKHTSDKLFYNFFSAWSPPTPVIRKMSEEFPKLTFSLRYYEGGSGFKGAYVAKGGVVRKDDTSGYSGRRGG